MNTSIEKDSGQLQIALLTALDLQEISTWSWAGTIHHMAEALQTHCGNVTYVNALHCKELMIGKYLHKVSRHVLKKNYTYRHSLPVAKKYAHMLPQKLAEQNFDLIVTPAGETEIAFLETTIPIILIEDATYGQLINYYQDYSNLLQRSARDLHTLEARALRKARVIVASSPWNARSVIGDYHIEPEKIHVLPFGASFDIPPSRDIALTRKKSKHCRLLHIAASWTRKGGDIAFETLLKLEEMGIEAELIICGCIPPDSYTHTRMTVIPYLNKKDKRQREDLELLYCTADFLLLPTRADCTPIVFSEASAYGLPVITTDTGGVSGVITEGVNGFMLPYTARGDAYAKIIAGLYQNEQRYMEMVRSSRDMFESRLNWDSWGISIQRITRQVLERDSSTFSQMG